MSMSPAALRFGSLFSILTPASKLFANPLVGSAQDVKTEDGSTGPDDYDSGSPVNRLSAAGQRANAKRKAG